MKDDDSDFGTHLLAAQNPTYNRGFGGSTVNDFCERWKIGRSTFYEETRAGKLATKKVRGRTVITHEAEAAWAARLPDLSVDNQPQISAMTKAQIPKPSPKPRFAPSCASCLHYWKIDEPSGFCRRFPPSLKIDGNSSAYVPVKAEWRCGEFKSSRSH